MAYNPYTNDQINQFIDSKGIGNDPWAMLAYAKQNNADPMQVAAARGIDPAAAQQWLTSAQQQMSGPIQDTRGLADRNPYMAYMVSQNRGQTADQAGATYGKSGADINSWLSNAGLSLTPPGAATMPPIGGTPTPANNSPATPNPYLSGGAPSTAGSTPATMNGGGNGTVGVPDYMVAAPSGQSRNPYLPAGGQGSNYGNDPRMGGPMGNQGVRGLAGYLFQNPSTMAMGNELTRNINNNLFRNVLPQIEDGAAASGMVGGSRQGVAQGLAIGDAMSGLAGSLANLYGNQFNQDRSYGLANDTLDFNIHQGNLGTMRQGQLDQMNFIGQMADLNQRGIGAATQVQNTPLTRWQQFSDTGARLGGLGSQNSQQLNGNPYLSAIGGAMAGYKMFGG
jgi:hypothetical protein